jgi:hypothetical protein
MKNPIHPTKKSAAIDDLLTALMGRSRPQTIRSGGCMLCSDPNTNFRDALSERDYAITGMCQDCQDDFYKEDA